MQGILNLVKVLGFACVLFVVLACPMITSASELSTQEILEKLKTHQNKIKSIEAEFTMTLYGVDKLQIEQTGTFSYTAPDQVRMEFKKPRPQVIKTQGKESYISINNGPFKKIPTNEKLPGGSSDLFYYRFIKQFYLDIDLKNKPSEGHLYKILGFHKNEDGSLADSTSVLNQKACEFIYDRNQGLISRLNLTGHGSMPPIETQLRYESKNSCLVPKSVFTRVITPGGAISSVVKLENRKVEKK